MEPLERCLEDSFGASLARWADENQINHSYVKIQKIKGWPDRLLLWGTYEHAHQLWIEWKRPGEQPTPMQKHVHKILRGMGQDVRVYDNKQLALDEVKATMLSTLRADTGDEAPSGQRWDEIVSTAGQGQDLHNTKSVRRPKKARDGGRVAGAGPAPGDHD